MCLTCIACFIFMREALSLRLWGTGSPGPETLLRLQCWLSSTWGGKRVRPRGGVGQDVCWVVTCKVSGRRHEFKRPSPSIPSHDTPLQAHPNRSTPAQVFDLLTECGMHGSNVDAEMLTSSNCGCLRTRSLPWLLQNLFAHPATGCSSCAHCLSARHVRQAMVRLLASLCV